MPGINDRTARQIAGWYQSPGTHGVRFAELASCGTVSDPSGLKDDIDREIKAADVETAYNGVPYLVWLNRLRTWLYFKHPEAFPAFELV